MLDISGGQGNVNQFAWQKYLALASETVKTDGR